ncbi:hypothetical protein D3C86_1481100 [compost metagenome]
MRINRSSIELCRFNSSLLKPLFFCDLVQIQHGLCALSGCKVRRKPGIAANTQKISFFYCIFNKPIGRFYSGIQVFFISKAPVSNQQAIKSRPVVFQVIKHGFLGVVVIGYFPITFRLHSVKQPVGRQTDTRFELLVVRLKQAHIAHVKQHVIGCCYRLCIGSPLLGKTFRAIKVILACGGPVKESASCMLLCQFKAQCIFKAFLNKDLVLCHIGQHPHGPIIRIFYSILFRIVYPTQIFLGTNGAALVVKSPPARCAILFYIV